MAKHPPAADHSDRLSAIAKEVANIAQVAPASRSAAQNERLQALEAERHGLLPHAKSADKK